MKPGDGLIPIPFETEWDCIQQHHQHGLSAITAANMCVAISLALEYRETGNAAMAADAYSFCVREGLQPPLEIMEWLSDAFDAMLADPEGKPDVAKALGLKGGKGGTPFQQARKQRGRRMDLREMAGLIGTYGVTVEQAAEMVGRRNEEEGLGGVESPDTLMDYYYRQRRDVYAMREQAARAALQSARLHIDGEDFGPWEPDDRTLRAELRRYPLDAIPPVLRERFSIQ